jgi:protein O-mannosyl-transferase
MTTAPRHAAFMQWRNPGLTKRWLIGTGLALVTLVLYLPVLHHGFVDYDDQQYVTDNPHVQAGLTWSGLVWAFGFHAGNWHPLAWLSHMLDCQIYAANAGGHHLTSLILHVASTLMLYLILQRATKAAWRSAAVAALFAWHPLHVESVAWVAERKDVLCGFFWMLTLWLYVRFTETPGVSRYLETLGAFILCLMSKPMGVTLPFVLLLLDYWPLQRLACKGGVGMVAKQSSAGVGPVDSPPRSWRQLVLEKLPFIVLSAIACGLTLHAQEMTIVSTAGLPVVQRFAHVLVAYEHYLMAMFVPWHLAVYYPFQIHLSGWLFGGASLVLGLITLAAIQNWRRRPYLLMGWLWYLGTLVPVIGLVQVGDQAWADRYTYLPLVGPSIALIWLVCEIKPPRRLLQCLMVAIAAGLLMGTFRQLRYWENTRTLFEHAEKVTHNNYMAVTILGSLLAQEGKLDAAITDYQTALDYQPTFPEAHFFLGNALEKQGKLDAAVAEYEQALWFKPTQEQTHIFLGMILARQKKYDLAIDHYEAALKANPDSAVAQNNLARILQTLGRLDEAVEHDHAALAIDPKLSLAHNNLGILLIQKGDYAGGTIQLRDALRLNPTNTETQFNLALALNQQQQWPEAAELFAKTVPAGPPDPKAHYQFAVALGHLNRTREAMGQYAAALLLQPDFPDALDGLAWILSTDANPAFRNGAEAVKMAYHACELTGNQDPEKLKTLSAAYAESGSYAAAVQTIRTAKDLAARDNRPGLDKECSNLLKQFQNGQPWRNPDGNVFP